MISRKDPRAVAGRGRSPGPVHSAGIADDGRIETALEAHLWRVKAHHAEKGDKAIDVVEKILVEAGGVALGLGIEGRQVIDSALAQSSKKR